MRNGYNSCSFNILRPVPGKCGDDGPANWYYPILPVHAEHLLVTTPLNLWSNSCLSDWAPYDLVIADSVPQNVLFLFFFCVNPLLFASCTDTFSKWCKITRGMKRSAQ
jgi:hypothetical protein